MATMLLPTEIVFLILDQLRPRTSESVLTALAVSAISRHWRATALSTPSLWSTFSISLRTGHKAFLPTFLERSASAPLDITISFDFSRTDHSAESKVQDADALLCLHAHRLQRLHLRFVAHLQLDYNTLTTFIRFRSSSLRHIELDALQEDEAEREQFNTLLFMVAYKASEECWSERCPALTHITTNNAEFIVYPPTKITTLCIKGVTGRRDLINSARLYDVLQQTTALTELILDGVSLAHALGTASLPHLRALSLRSDPLEYVGEGFWRKRVPKNASVMAAFFLSLRAPALSSLTIPELNTAIPEALGKSLALMPSVTRLAIVPSGHPSWLRYPTALPAVEELVLLGADPYLHDIAGPSGDAWRNLRTLHLPELERPSPQYLQKLSNSLYSYARQRMEAGHGDKLLVQLPRGVVLQDMSPDAGEFMKFYTA